LIPVVTTQEMKRVDGAATDAVEVLIGRAGRAVARAAVELLGGAYGRRVVVVAGKGNNGADGRAAAVVLRHRGVRVTVVDAASDRRLPGRDLVIDAAYGTGFRGSYVAPDSGDTPVLAVDIPSGLNGDTGAAGEGRGPLTAAATVTFQAYKPGLLLGEGPDRCGHVVVADIGLGPLVDEIASSWLVTDWDVGWLPRPARDTHKWKTAVLVVAGSPGMMGAPVLVSRASMRAGAGYVRLGVPGAGLETLPSGREAVGVALPATGWEAAAAEAAVRCRALVMGPGLGRSPEVGHSVAALLARVDCPVLLDADGINALGSVEGLRRAVAGRTAATVITPHDGEYTALTGEPPGTDRLGAVRALAATSGAVVLLKGTTTVVAAPDGRAWLVTSGSPRLATAGTGDALSGVIGAFLARGVPAPEAAALAAHVHGRAAGLGRPVGLVAGDLPDLVSAWLSAASPGATS
jgi:ADP-dependent NAD(P)H-hydrate dehydratase / NAD(P)H-hydrate epimerase